MPEGNQAHSHLWALQFLAFSAHHRGWQLKNVGIYMKLTFFFCIYIYIYILFIIVIIINVVIILILISQRRKLRPGEVQYLSQDHISSDLQCQDSEQDLLVPEAIPLTILIECLLEVCSYIQLIFIEHFYRPSTVSCMRAGQQIRSKKAHLAARLTGEQKKSEGSEKTGSSMTKLGLPIRTSDSRPRTLSFYQKSVSQGQEIFTLQGCEIVSRIITWLDLLRIYIVYLASLAQMLQGSVSTKINSGKVHHG